MGDINLHSKHDQATVSPTLQRRLLPAGLVGADRDGCHVEGPYSRAGDTPATRQYRAERQFPRTRDTRAAHWRRSQRAPALLTASERNASINPVAGAHHRFRDTPVAGIAAKPEATCADNGPTAAQCRTLLKKALSNLAQRVELRSNNDLPARDTCRRGRWWRRRRLRGGRG